jgi:hypothetical protein
VAKISAALSWLIIASIDFCTATVSGTFSSSITLTLGIFFRIAAACACAWL